MNLLYCNCVLEGRSGTEIVTIETALGLQQRGINVCVYSSRPGASSRALTDRGVPVIGDLGDAPWTPDLVHCNHLTESLGTAARFPDTPQVFVCHDATIWHSRPPKLSLVRRWMAVDEICAERIRAEGPDTVADVRWMPNAVDLATHHMREPLPSRPRRALLLAKQPGYDDVVAGACNAAGIELDQLGHGRGIVVDDLPAVLSGYDVVFASARSAIESMACGCAVIVGDARGLAGLVTPDNVKQWRRHNFGQRILTRPLTAEALVSELANYSAEGSRAVSGYIREVASLSDYLDELVSVYAEAIDDFARAPIDPRVTLREYSATISAMISDHDGASSNLYGVIDARLRAESELAARQADLSRMTEALAASAASQASLRERLAEANEAMLAAHSEIAIVRNPLKRIQRKLRKIFGTHRSGLDA